MTKPLAGIFKGYSGYCDNCGSPIAADILTVSDTSETDKYGNPLFYVLGIPENETELLNGADFFCGECRGRIRLIRLYVSIAVSLLDEAPL